MRTLILSALILIVLISCEKQNENLNDTENAKDSIIKLFENSYLPLDTNDIWIYERTSITYDDVIDDIDDTIGGPYTSIYYDTVKPSQDFILGKYTVRKFQHNYFNTQLDRVLLVIDSIESYSDTIQAINILFTEIEDTIWVASVISAWGEKCEVEFTQKLNNNSSDNSIELKIKGGFCMGLYDHYVFKKNVGIVYKYADGINSNYTTNLLEYINN